MKIGETTTDPTNAGKRDAFHVPCILATSHDTLHGGDGVRFVDRKFVRVERSNHEDQHAIVDPFAGRVIKPGTYFWALLIPESTSNLAHHFDVEFDDVPEPKVIDEDDPQYTPLFERQEVELDGEDPDDTCRGCW